MSKGGVALKKRIVLPIFAVALCASFLIGVAVGSRLFQSDSAGVGLVEQNELGQTGTVSGGASGTIFETNYSLENIYGNKVNFWIQNNGQTSVSISINGQNARLIPPAGQGNVTAQVGAVKSQYSFQAVSVPGGQRINIQYKIAQKN